MRKIEKQMIAAIRNREEWRNNNTAVFYISAQESGNPHGSRSEIYLHGNLIAEYWHDFKCLELNEVIINQWNTRTTRSRVNALGATAYIRKGLLYMSPSPIIKEY